MRRAVAITCEGVSKSFALIDRGNAWRIALGLDASVARYKALQDVTFDVPKGQFVGILGRNGAGKSTLLRIIGGAYAPDIGRVSVTGAMSALYELGVVASRELTGRQYADRLLMVHGFGPRERSDMIADIHGFSELGDRFDDPVQTYSAGMGARLFFATATAGQYDIYLLDEILSVGDQHFQSKCWRRLRDRLSRGATGILVTHDWAAILRLCETAHILEGGKVIFSGPADRAVRQYLYGDQAGDEYVAGIAKFKAPPSYPPTIRQGEDFIIRAEAEILQPSEVFSTFTIERLQPGFGWETSVMSRAPVLIGHAPGRYVVEASVPAFPLEPGHYQCRLGLMLVDETGKRIGLDGYSWLDGTGLALEVVGQATGSLVLPARWTLQ
ncbi:ATP-binding cassette domain-containing protein [Bradyrhizobium sp. Pear77]|uniref:ABC transporter ATP-binding protein n=1 Tax=Bradyrhizobium altum TaxID=1571202 RepID=UPI001E651CD9|nr:ABC transporter ATP-binding protein [Bradyrhizobium altum]MCC8952082.1 ATP-binding cassette domain-containing protein [Bradyrhizobium altum]